MKRSILTAALLLASLSAEAHPDRPGRGDSCNVSSGYSVDTYRRAFLFKREDGKPGEIGIGGGRLFIDGREQKLSAADHERLRRLEGEMTALVPQIREIAIEAVDIAFAALTEVARGLSSSPRETVASLESAHRKVRSEMSAKPLSAFDEDAMASVVKPIITEYIPAIVGGAVSGALSAAFGGEQKANDFERRMQRMEKELNSKVEDRAKELEPLAEAMCTRLRAMDSLDDSLEFRLPDGKPMDLLRTRRDDKN